MIRGTNFYNNANINPAILTNGKNWRQTSSTTRPSTVQHSVDSVREQPRGDKRCTLFWIKPNTRTRFLGETRRRIASHLRTYPAQALHSVDTLPGEQLRVSTVYRFMASAHYMVQAQHSVHTLLSEQF